MKMPWKRIKGLQIEGKMIHIRNNGRGHSDYENECKNKNEHIHGNEQKDGN